MSTTSRVEDTERLTNGQTDTQTDAQTEELTDKSVTTSALLTCDILRLNRADMTVGEHLIEYPSVRNVDLFEDRAVYPQRPQLRF